MEDKTILSIVGSSQVTLLLAWALYLGHDGVLLAGGCSLIAAIIGLKIKTPKVLE